LLISKITVKTIITEEVKENLDNNKDFLLVDVLMKNSFEANRIILEQ